MIESGHPQLSIRHQCELVGLNRSTFYYTPAQESDLNLHLMRLIDTYYTKAPFYGRRRMTAYLRCQGYEVNPKRVRRLMQKMGLQAIYPKRRTSIAAKGHKVYPYLLRNLAITRPNQVWSTDITYIRMLRGFMYLVAIMDWHSRYVLAWQLSNTLDGLFCLDALDLALAQGVIFRAILGHVFSPIEGQGFSPKLVHRFSPKVGHSFSAKLGHRGAGGIPPSQAYSLFVGKRGERKNAWKEERRNGHSRDPETPAQGPK
jgi:hypothetical protein